MNSKIEDVIRIENLSKSYGRNRGIDQVSFTVKKGDIFGFLGPNGAGKSTTIRCLLGLIRFEKGSARILNQDAGKEMKKILSKVGYMPSEAMFYPSMKVSEIIKFAADARKMDCREEALKLCERLQVDEGKKIEELSLGNRKKVSIVCAMQHKPELFIFDEPTSGLDPFMQSEFFQLIMEYNKAGATCLLSSHVLSEVRKYCNKTAIIKEGKIICVDSMENLAHTNSKRVKVTGAVELSLTGMEQVKRTGDSIEFSYHGEMNPLLEALQGKSIKDLVIEESPLEDIFMHFYGEE